MLLSIGLVLLVLGIALFQSTQGFFSALIMAVFTVCCAALAFGTFEYVAVKWLAPLWRPDFSFSIALGATFGIPLLALRLGTDRLIRRSSLLPVWVDRIGGGICGLTTGMIAVGVVACCVLWLPHGTATLGFARVDIPAKVKGTDSPDPTPPNPDAPVRELLLTPDRFAVTVAGMLGDGLFSGSSSFTGSHPDLVRSMAWVGAVPPEVSRFVQPESITFLGSELLQNVYREIPGSAGGGGRRGSEVAATAATVEPVSPKSGHEFRLVRVGLKKEARDARKSYVFTLRQFRLVGRRGTEEPIQQFHAVALQQNKLEGSIETVNRHIKLTKTIFGDWPLTDDIFAPRNDSNQEVEVVFELPKGFIPEYLEYKYGARVALDQAPQPRDSGSPEKQASDDGGEGRRARRPAAEEAPSGGNVKRYAVRKGKSFFGDSLPTPLKAYRKPSANTEIRKEALVGGHLIANLEEQESGTNDAVSKFHIPEDKRLLQLNTGYMQAKSTLGKAMSFAVETIQNYTVDGDNGETYEVVGKYAVADVDGKQVCEIQYFSDRAGSLGQLGPFKTVKNTHLKNEYEFVLLFLVDPGVQITSFSTGGEANRRDDLRAENLRAPD